MDICRTEPLQDKEGFLYLSLLARGRLLSTLTGLYIGDSAGIPLLLHDITHIVTPDIGIVVSIAGYEWRVVHVYEEGTKCVLAKEYLEENVSFDSGGSTTYMGSDIMQKCTEFYNNLPSGKFKSSLLPIQVHPSAGGQAGQLVWLAQSNWISTRIRGVNPPGTVDSTFGDTGGAIFDYFRDNSDNDVTRVYKTKDGNDGTWWTASARTDNLVWGVSTRGAVQYDGIWMPTASFGFRPFVAVPVTVLPT